jgi:hypothetical protein
MANPYEDIAAETKRRARLEAADRAMEAAPGYSYDQAGEKRCDNCAWFLPDHREECKRKAWEELRQ